MANQLTVVKHEITNTIELQVNGSGQRRVTMVSVHDRFTTFASSIKILVFASEYYDCLKDKNCGEAIKKSLTDAEKANFKWSKDSSDRSSCGWSLEKPATISEINRRFARVTKVIEHYLNKK